MEKFLVLGKIIMSNRPFYFLYIYWLGSPALHILNFYTLSIFFSTYCIYDGRKTNMAHSCVYFIRMCLWHLLTPFSLPSLPYQKLKDLLTTWSCIFISLYVWIHTWKLRRAGLDDCVSTPQKPRLAKICWNAAHGRSELSCHFKG